MEIHIGVDVGGTFTDLAVSIPGENRQIRHKLPSTPDRPDVAIVEGIATVLAEHGLDAGNVIRLSHGTTAGTNALMQRKVGKVAVVTGGGSGIGEATARRLAEAGCKVVVAGRRKTEIERGAGDVSGLAVATDVSVEASAADVLSAVAPTTTESARTESTPVLSGPTM